jgi:hypothetical protein
MNSATVAATPSATETVSHCYYIYAGDDQRSRPTIAIGDHNGKGGKS